MTAVDELLAFIRRCLDAKAAELDEDERVARAAADDLTCGCHPGANSTTWQWSDPHVRTEQHSFVGVEDWTNSIDEQVGEHIARWDPARVLARVEHDRRDIEAKRRILDAHGRPHGCIALTGAGEHSAVDGQPWELWELEHTADHGPCFVVRTLAQPYAEQPGWREEWRA